MPKGYWIAHGDVNDPVGYEEYKAANAIALQKYGARFLVRGGTATAVEGKLRSRHVVLEFADYETALACYNSPEYQAAIEKRKGRSVVDCTIVEGYDGVQPA